MQISGLQDNSVFPPASSPQTIQRSGSSFSGSLIDATDSSDSSAVQEFMAYAHETPAQRMFTNWLAGQDISQSQYDAMTAPQKEALMKKFEEQLKQDLAPNAPATFTATEQLLSNSLNARATAKVTSSLLS